MNFFEIHITVGDVFNIEKFKSDCVSINIKPIIIETQNDTVRENQVMTSSTHKESSYMDTLNKLSSLLIGLGYNILRQKVEIKPLEEKNKDFKYYETHVRLKLPKEFDNTLIRQLCDYYKFHLSKNLFKTDNEYNYQMCTFRDKYLTLDNFLSYINKFHTHLIENNIKYDKTEIEECIYDTNERIDFDWMFIGQTRNKITK